MNAALGDVNGDGSPDIATPNLSGSVTFLLNDGAGYFPDRIDVAMPDRTKDVRVLDDGRVPIGIENTGVVIGSGLTQTGFAEATVYGVPAGGGLYVADVDVDGQTDILVAAPGLPGRSISVLYGNGGGFTPVTYSVYPSSPTKLAVADVNVDGLPDIVFNESSVDVLGVLDNLGERNFNLQPLRPTLQSPTGIQTGDFNRDGLDDVLISTTNDDQRPVVSLFFSGPDGLGPQQFESAGLFGPANDVTVGEFDPLTRLGSFVVTSNPMPPVTGFSDNFDGGVLDPQHWTIGRPVVVQEGGRLRLEGRGYLVTANEYPDGVNVRLDWTWEDHAGPIYPDHLAVILRSDASVNNSWPYEARNGIMVKFNPHGGGFVHIDRWDATIGEYVRLAATEPVALPAGVWRSIQITDNNQQISVYIDNFETPILTAQVADTFTHHYIEIYNRENVAGLHVSYIDNFVLVSPVAEENEPPIADDHGEVLDEDTFAAIVVTATDPEGEAVTYLIVDGPQHGTLSEFDPVSGSVVYTPDPDWIGLDTFTFAASDGSLESDPATVYVRVDPINDAPQAADAAMQVSNEQSVVVDVCEFASDVETPCDELSFEVSDPLYGTVEWLDSHTFQYTSELEFEGLEELPYTVTDTGDGESEPLSADAVIQINVFDPNEPPVALPGEEFCSEDEPCELTLFGEDPDGDDLTFRIVTQPQNGTIIAFDPATGRLVYQADPNYNGADSVTFVVDDGEVESESATVEIVVDPVNDPPVAIGGVVTVSEYGSLSWSLEAMDPDEGDVLTFIVVSSPEHGCLEFDEETGAVHYTPQEGFVGDGQFEFLVDDNSGEENSLSQPATVTITVAPLAPGFEFGAGILTVTGTPGNDSIRLVFTGRGYNVVTNFGTFNVPRRSDVQSVFVRARDGNDIVNVSALPLQTTADLYAGAGNDRITGGRGHDVLVGDDGNDTITGGAGDDLIIGGAGRNRLVGSAGSDVLIAGMLDLFEEDLCIKLDPRDVLDIWRSATTPEDRLDAVESLFDRVLDDDEIDLLTGSTGADAFLRGDLDQIVDFTRDDLVVPAS